MVCFIQPPWGLLLQSSESERLPHGLSQRSSASVFPKERQKLSATGGFPNRRVLTVTRWLPVLSLRLPWSMALSRSHPHLWSEPKLQVGPVAITGVCPQDSVSEKAEPVAPLQKDPPSTGGPLGSLSRVRLVCFQLSLLPPPSPPGPSSFFSKMEFREQPASCRDAGSGRC